MIATVGDNCMDVYAKESQSFPGGNAVNVAVYLQRLGVHSSYTGYVGNDQYGEKMKQALASKGVDTSHLHTVEGKTAITMVELVNGDRVFGDYDEGVMAGFNLSPQDIDFLCQHELIHTAIWGNIENQLPALKACNAIISFDYSDQLEHTTVAKALPYTDYAFFSYKQDDSYIRDYIHQHWNQANRSMVVTLGENGSIAYDGNKFYTQGIVPVPVVDTMGAGDSFIAGFLSAIEKGYPLEACLRCGADSAATTIQYMGAWHVD